MTFNIQQEFISGNSEIKTLFSDTYGLRTYMKGTGGALYDPSWDIFRAYAEIKLGFFLGRIGTTFYSKAAKIYQLDLVAQKEH